MPEINNEGKVQLFHKTTGQTSEHHPIDAADIVNGAADDGLIVEA